MLTRLLNELGWKLSEATKNERAKKYKMRVLARRRSKKEKARIIRLWEIIGRYDGANSEQKRVINDDFQR